MKLGIFAVAVVSLFLAPSGHAQTQHILTNALPAMTGIASAPKEVKSRALFTYAITATDKDTWNVAASGFPAQLQQEPDTNLTATCTAMRSMSDWTMAFRGSAQDGTSTWDVSGTAVIVSAPTTRIDDFTVVNNTVSPGTDVAVSFSQTVEITLVQSGPGT